MRLRGRSLTLVSLAVMELVVTFAGAAPVGDLRMVSLSSNGLQLAGDQMQPDISADGSVVAFVTTVGTRTAGTDDTRLQVMVRHIDTGMTEVVSVTDGGIVGSGDSGGPSLSADGRYVAFESTSALVEDDTNGLSDVYVRDTMEHRTILVSADATGAAGDGASSLPSISDDGRYVAFHSKAPSLGGNASWGEALVRNLHSGLLTLASVGEGGRSSRGAYAGRRSPVSITTNGRYVLFLAWPNRLVPSECAPSACLPQLFVKDMATGALELISRDTGGAPTRSQIEQFAISPSGRLVAFWSTTGGTLMNRRTVLSVFDRVTHSTRVVTTDPDGAVASEEDGGARVTEYLLSSGSTTIALRIPAFSADDRWLVFRSASAVLVPGDTNQVADVFAHDLADDTTTRLSVSMGGRQADLGSGDVSISADGSRIAFTSWATNLVRPDMDPLADVLLLDRPWTPCPSGAVDAGPGSGVVRDAAAAVPDGRAASCALADHGL